MSPAPPPVTPPPPVGPAPADKPAAFNPYTADGTSSVQAQPAAAPARGYAVNPNPATISNPTTASHPIDHGVQIGARVAGSERLFKALSYGFELLKGMLVLVIILVLVNLFVATIFRISGESMLPNFADGQFIVVDKLSYLLHPPVRGDVVVIRFPADPDHRKFIKRVIGLPGEKVEIRNGLVYVDERQLQELYLPTNLLTSPDLVKVLRGDEYFLVGDNRPNSNDSRFFGPVPLDEFVGKSQAILSGKAFGWVAQPAF